MKFAEELQDYLFPDTFEVCKELLKTVRYNAENCKDYKMENIYTFEGVQLAEL